jgi:NADPH-dependent 2,4-dienoyl-CoA reductase/sulfur reductase-like enzyme
VRLPASPVCATSVLIIGASLAGVRTAQGLRSAGFDGHITIIGAEPEQPYDRPPLSKQFLAGTWEEGRITLPVPDDVTLVLGRSAVRFNASTKTVSTDDGSEHRADAVVIATGTRVRPLPGPTPAQPVYVIRTLADSQTLRDRIVSTSASAATPLKVVVIGAGFIGSEVASTTHGLGCAVTVIEAAAVPYERALGAELGQHCASLHGRNGVNLECGVGVAAINEHSVVLSDGRELAADVVVAGIGVVPNVEWLAGSGLQLNDGVHCDEFLCAQMTDGTRADGVYAVGDVARWPNSLFPLNGHAEQMRVEHWTTAAEMGDYVGQMIATGSPEAQNDRFTPIPYFWSDQYGMKIQFLGRGSDADEVQIIDGPDEQGRLLALYRRGDHLSGVLGISKMKALMGYRAKLADGARWADVLGPTSTK